MGFQPITWQHIRGLCDGVIAYNSLLDSCVRAEEWQAALTILWQMPLGLLQWVPAKMHVGTWGIFFSARRSGFKHFSICYGMPECNICIDLCKRLRFDTMNRARLFHQICFHFNLLAPPGIISTEISQPGDSELAALFFILSLQEPTYKLRKQFLSEAFSSKKSFCSLTRTPPSQPTEFMLSSRLTAVISP